MFPYTVLHNLVPVPVYHEVFLYLLMLEKGLVYLLFEQ